MNVNDTEIAWSIMKDAGYQKSMNVLEVSILIFCNVSQALHAIQE